jgi:hypothetical protein
MLFKTRFHAGLRDGSVTLTFRRWAAPKVKIGGEYRVTPGPGALVVSRVDEVIVGKITAREVGRAGFQSFEELKDALRTRHGGVNARSRVYRVQFRYVAGAGAAPKTTGTSADAVAIADKLAAVDRRTARGPWTAGTLRLIRENPKRRAGDLAPIAGRDLKAFKSDVRKLKAFGLTQSFEVGYGLTPLGRAVLKKLG